MTGVERAGQAVAEAWGRVYRLAAGQPVVEPKGLDAALNNLVRAVREQVACEIEVADGDAPWALPSTGRTGSWIDSRDATKAARIAREGLTKETR